MKDKIAFLMKSEGLSTTRLAEILEIQPSAVSHLVSGRNKPGYDLLQKILRRFPQINPDWLLLDSDVPYREALTSTAAGEDGGEAQLSESAISATSEQCRGEYPLDSEHDNSRQGIPIGAIKSMTDQKKSGKSPKFVVIFYDDGSCENFNVKW